MHDRTGIGPRSTLIAIGLRCAAAVVVLFLAAAASGLAAGSALRLGDANDARLGQAVVVSPSGRTLYALTPETTHHLLCTSRSCLGTWMPLTVPSPSTRLSEATGVSGSLGRLHRAHGVVQVTLRGMPLYRFIGDHARGQANGEGIHSFGGVWHAVIAQPGMSSPAAPAPAPPPPPTYGY